LLLSGFAIVGEPAGTLITAENKRGFKLRKNQTGVFFRIRTDTGVLRKIMTTTNCGKPSPKVWPLFLIVLLMVTVQPIQAQDVYSHFIGLTNFASFSQSTNSDGSITLTTPDLKWDAPWNELIVSWNADAPAGTWLKIEARAEWPGHTSKFYTMGLWNRDNVPFPRASVSHQRDADGTVDEDTLELKQPATTTQVRVTLNGTNGLLPALKFLGLSFCNTHVTPVAGPANQAAWGKIISTPERSQKGYPGASGWCSPTSLSMDLARWAELDNRPEWNHTVPDTAAGVLDHDRHATGNWPFNTAFAGSLPGMRGYVTRFSDMSELEDWVAAGIPVVISARWDLLEPGRPEDLAGHLTVCIGFTSTGDPVINDPATNPLTPHVRRIYKRANVLRAWATSHNTVYIVYPENYSIPPSPLGDW
jgi:hypothetical protein